MSEIYQTIEDQPKELLIVRVQALEEHCSERERKIRTLESRIKLFIKLVDKDTEALEALEARVKELEHIIQIKVPEILEGIDETYTGSSNGKGYWDITAGAEFGKGILREIEQLITTTNKGDKG